MKRCTLFLVLFLTIPLVASADVTKEDIRKLVSNNISDSVIVAFIRANQPVHQLTSDEIIELKNIGASDAVLEALVGTSTQPARTATANTNAPVQQVVQNRTVVVERQTPSTVYYASGYPYAYDSAYYTSYSYPAYSYNYYPTYSYAYTPYYYSAYRPYYRSSYYYHRPYYRSYYHHRPSFHFSYHKSGRRSSRGVSFTW